MKRWRCKGHEKCNEIKSVLSVKESNFNEKRSKFSHLLTVRAEVADAAPPYCQPDRKISVFLTTPLNQNPKRYSSILMVQGLEFFKLETDA